MEGQQASHHLLVFGASGAIGSAICGAAKQRGWRVTGVARHWPQQPGSGIEPLSLDPFAADFDAGALAHAAPFDAVCWAQGANQNDSVYDVDLTRHLEIYKANVVYILSTLKALLAGHSLSPAARMCVISSIWPNLARQSKLSYCVSKAALQGLILSASADLAKDGHLINAVLPGALETPMTRRNLAPEQIGGQVKLPDLSRSKVRQRGIQEIDGVAIAKPITERSELIETIVDQRTFATLTRSGARGRKGPVFLELPLDIQGAQVDADVLNTPVPAFKAEFPSVSKTQLQDLVERVKKAKRPVFLLGAGIDRETSAELAPLLAKAGVPTMVTWNATDRLGANHPAYFGRPNTWGMRYSNILLQQADLLIALGTRLSLQQSGFAWQEFVPAGEIVQVDCDESELEKGHPKVALGLRGDANEVLRGLLAQSLGDHAEWVDFCNEVRSTLPLVEPVNQTGEGYLNPYRFAEVLSDLCTGEDIVIPCSSGSAFTVMMQTFAQREGQRIVTNKGLASMGYGLSGAIGAAFAANGRRTVLVEGDGGFTQNLQELGTVTANKLNIKIFLFDDNGYASIRMTQRNYFGGRYVGCDTQTGLGIPKWEQLFPAYSVPVMRIGPGYERDPAFLKAFNAPGAHAFLVHIDPVQTYFPKITSHVTASGSMQSNPLHRMTPDLDSDTAAKVFRYITV